MNQSGSSKRPLLERLKNDFSILSEIFRLIRNNRKWWLLPILFVVGFLGLFLTFVGGNSILPAIYVLF